MDSIMEANSSPLSFLADLAGLDVSVAKDIEKLFNKQSNASSPYLHGSISNYTKNLVMTFPMLCDNSLSPETASMISRANERYIVNMFQLLFNAAQFSGSDGVDVLSSVHKNMRVKRSLDDYIDFLDNMVGESATDLVSEAALKDVVRKMEGELKKPHKNFPTDSFSHRSLNDFIVKNLGAGKCIVKETVLNEAPFDFRVWTVDGKPVVDDQDKERLMHRSGFFAKFDNDDINKPIDPKDYNDAYAKALKAEYDQRKEKREIEKQNWDRARADYDKERFGFDKEKNYRERDMHRLKVAQMYNQDLANSRDMISKQLMDTDIKKANEMAPTLMMVNYNVLDPADGKLVGKNVFVAGVKSRLVSVDSSDIVDRVAAKNRTRLSFLNFIRATTGEIGFMKDFVLCLNQAHLDALNSLKKGEAADTWKTLEVLAAKNAHRKLRRSGNDASAITVLVINQETVNLIKKQYEFDLEQVSNAWKVMGDYNLLGIIIADESTESVKFLYAGHDMWEQQAYSYLEKETNDRSYKKVINLLGQQNRRF